MHGEMYTDTATAPHSSTAPVISYRQSLPARNRRFQFKKRRQLFFGAHNETLPAVAMRVGNPDCPSFTVHR